MGKHTYTKELRRMLDERGVAWVAMSEGATEYTQEGIVYRAYEVCDKVLQVATIVTPVTPEQAIAATVGNRTDLSKRLREVNGLHEFAELFGFSWADESDWTWHDVACAMADAVDAAMAGNRSCASCPEMDNPDSYISHIHEALEWHDEHVPRPTHPMSTCVVLEGEKVPEEVLFIGTNGVTHYLPEDVTVVRTSNTERSNGE